MIYFLKLMCSFAYVWINIFLLLGIGFIAAGIIKLKFTTNNLLSVGFFGLAITIFSLEIANFFVPIASWAFMVYFSLGVIGCIKNYDLILSFFLELFQKKLLIIPALMVAILWVMGAVNYSTYTDLGLYYLSTIRWINESNIVFGLGNLHGRLAFNQSIFFYDALLNLFPLLNFGYAIVESIIIFLVSLSVINFYHSNVKGARFLSVIFFFAIASAGSKLSWGSPDTIISLFQVEIYVIFIPILLNFIHKRNIDPTEVICLLFILILCSTIKISSVVFCISVFILLSPILLRLDLKSGHKLALLALSLLFIFQHLLRGFVLSGYPLYPSTVLGLPSAEWAMPIIEVQREFSYIYLWARSPNSNFSILNDWQWVRVWVSNFPLEGFRYFYTAVTAAFISFICLLLRGKKRKFDYYIFTIPVVASIVFWFVSAPDWRFLGSTPDLLIAILLWYPYILLTDRRYFKKEGTLSFPSYVGLATLVIIIILILRMVGLKSIFRYELHHFPQAAYSAVFTESGLMIYVPIEEFGGICWDAPLPCTPVPKLNLSKFTPNSGFHKGYKVEDE